MGAFQGGEVKKGFAEMEKHANAMLDDLLWGWEP